jgi:ATP-binding cassette, subfamily C (CFTR/MRP), member 1
VEENFYARCPPEKRPDFRRLQSPPSAFPKEEETGPESIMPSTSIDKEKQVGEKNTSQTKWSRFQKKPKIFRTDSAGNIKYDSSLLKALHRTFFIRWWTAGILSLIASGLTMLEFFCVGS